MIALVAALFGCGEGSLAGGAEIADEDVGTSTRRLTYWMPNLKDSTNLQAYFPTSATLSNPKITYFYDRSPTGDHQYRGYYRMWFDDTHTSSYWTLYNAYQQQPGNPPGKLLIWEKSDAANCVLDQGILFFHDQSTKIVEVGDWMPPWGQSSCTIGWSGWVAFHYRDHYTGANSGIVWSDGVNGNELGTLQTLDTCTNGTCYGQMAYSEVPLRQKFTASDPFTPDHPWGGSHSNAIRIVLQHGVFDPWNPSAQNTCYNDRDYGNTIHQGGGYAYAAEYDHMPGWNSYFVNLYLAAGVGIVEWSLIFDETNALGYPSCAGSGMYESKFPGIIDYRQLVFTGF